MFLPQVRQGIAAHNRVSRKVRTPQSIPPDNIRDGAIHRTGPQKHTAPQGVRLKWWCKRPPANAAMRRPGNPREEQGQAGAFSCSLVNAPGGPHELNGNSQPREMIPPIQSSFGIPWMGTECGLSSGLGDILSSTFINFINIYFRHCAKIKFFFFGLFKFEGFIWVNQNH
jgi:hypothetical protein